MNRILRTAIIVFLAFFLGCAPSPYKVVIEPLKGVSANCYCRYIEMSKHYFDCKISDYLYEGFNKEEAREKAARDTWRFIAETQMKVARGANLRCECNSADPYSPYYGANHRR